jgi:hypothetical protein
MLNYIALYPNKYENEFNNEFLLSKNDTPLIDYIISTMREFEAIENIEILDYNIVTNQDEIDINQHSVNINFKKKDLSNIEIPKFKYMTDSKFSEIIFKIKVSTNLSEKIIEKRLLVPVEDNGFYLNNNKKMKAIWQLVDASTYSQRGKITLKARMPIIIYHNKHRLTTDVDGNEFILPSYSYALDTRSKRKGSKKKTKFINPLMIYSAKIGFNKTKKFFGMENIVYIVEEIKEKDRDLFYFFELDELFIKVDKYLFDKYDMVKSFVCMTANLRLKEFPLNYSRLEDKEYWTCRIGYLGAIKNKNILSFKEKGNTTVYMIERLLNNVTINNLRLPKMYKNNIYFLIYWMMVNFDELKLKNNLDMANKRIRKNEYIVLSSLGKKVSENINKIIEKKSKSKMNNMETLLELFNFSSDIIVSGMRNINDLIKSDELVNDLTFLLDLTYSSKGPNKLKCSAI